MPGVLSYREGFKEYRFPIFEEDGEIVFVASPSYQRFYLFFFFGGWTHVPTLLPALERERITLRVVQHLRKIGHCVRVMRRSATEQNKYEIHPELFEHRGKASEILQAAGFFCYSDYGSIDPLQKEYGLEVCGILEESKVEPITRALQTGFPQWHFGNHYYKDGGREPGWRFAIYMFSRCCPGGDCDGAG